MINLNLSGAELIARERQRQIEKEGFTPEHDSQHIEAELAYAAICYANPKRKYLKKREEGSLDAPLVTLPDGPEGPGEYYVLPETYWPFHIKEWKPVLSSRLREIAKAGAMLAAEGDRIRRQLITQFKAEALKVSVEALEPFDIAKAKEGAICITQSREIAICDFTRTKYVGRLDAAKNTFVHMHVYKKDDPTPVNFDEIEYNSAGKAIYGAAVHASSDNDIIGILPVSF